MEIRVRTLVVLVTLLILPKIAFCQEPKVFDKKFALASVYLIEATIFDVESTYAGLKNCSGCFEANPVVRSFVNDGRLATYLFQGSVNGAILYGAYYLKKEKHKYWWLGPVVVGSIHVVAGGFNMRFVF